MSCETGPSRQTRGGERAHLTGSFNYLTHPVLGRALSSLDGPSMWSGLDGYERTEG